MRYQLLLFCVYSCQVLSRACSSPQDCSLTPLAGDSTLVQCVDTMCVCDNTCFYHDNFDTTSLPCVLRSACYSYSRENDSCSLTTKRLTYSVIFAFLLGYAGAANYYVGRYTLAAIQSVLLVAVFSCCCCMCALNLYGCHQAREFRDSATCLFYIGVIGVIILAALSVCSFAWWFVDIFLFATSYNLDGNGCPLSFS